MDTVEQNPDFGHRTKVCFGGRADKIKQVWPALKKCLQVGFALRASRATKVNAAILFDGDGVWHSRIPFYGWDWEPIRAALDTLRATPPNNEYELLVWACDSPWSEPGVTVIFEDEFDQDPTVAKVQEACCIEMVDECNRFIPQGLAPLRLSLLLVRDFEGHSGDTWVDAFATVPLAHDVIIQLADMALSHGDGIVFSKAATSDMEWCRSRIDRRPEDIFLLSDCEPWLMDPHNTHLVCADALTLLLVQAMLEGKRKTHLHDVSVVQTAHVNRSLKTSGWHLPGTLAQHTNPPLWLRDTIGYAVTVTPYVYRPSQ
jgi:hypothetical protein